jgi:hypothetical protein
MINFSKINNLLTNKGNQKGKYNFGLNCIVHDMFITPENTIKYIYFETSNKVPCLLYVNSENFQIHKDIPTKKETELTVWSGYEPSTGYVLNEDNEIDVLPEITTSISPDPYIDVITMLSQTIKDVSYNLAVMVEDFLIVHDGEMVNVFNIRGYENPKLLIVVDLLTLTSDLSVTKIERIFGAINTIMIETGNKYWTNLHSLLLKCQELKIITKGKKSIDSTNVLTHLVKLQNSNRAINIALETMKLK